MQQLPRRVKFSIRGVQALARKALTNAMYIFDTTETRKNSERKSASVRIRGTARMRDSAPCPGAIRAMASGKHSNVSRARSSRRGPIEFARLATSISQPAQTAQRILEINDARHFPLQLIAPGMMIKFDGRGYFRRQLPNVGESLVAVALSKAQNFLLHFNVHLPVQHLAPRATVERFLGRGADNLGGLWRWQFRSWNLPRHTAGHAGSTWSRRPAHSRQQESSADSHAQCPAELNIFPFLKSLN